MPIEGKLGSLYVDKEQTQPLFPRTKTKAITDDDNIRLDIILDSLKTTVNSKASEAFVTNAIANAQLGGGEGDIDLSGYATKDDIANLDNAIKAIDYPVDSVNDKTGDISLNAEDVGAVSKTGDTMTGSLQINGSWKGVSFDENAAILNAGTRLTFDQRPQNSTGSCERYVLPTPTERTEDVWYNILTSKNPVTIAQGGTGAKTAADALTALGALPLAGGTMTGALTTTALTISGSSPTITFNETDSKNSSHIVNGNRHYLRSIASDTTYYEQFRTPTPSTGLTGNKSYDFLTTKTPVTIAQGGTGETTASAALTALGAASATPSISSANNSFHYAHLAKIGKLVICTLMPKGAASQAIYEETITIPSGYRPSANKTFTFYSDTAKNAGSSNGLVNVSVATSGGLRIASTYGVTVKEASQTYCWMTS